MKRSVIHYKLLLLFCTLFGGVFSLVAGQYYYFDNSTTYPFQQWCSESLMVRINSEGAWVRAGRFHLILDSGHFSYSTSDIASFLRTNLFNASSATFAGRSSSASPSWKPWSNHTILQIDRKNDITNYIWSNGLYWTVLGIVPIFSSVPYTWYVAMEYIPWPSTIETTLSAPWGYELIDQSKQIFYTTWYFSVEQAPCVADTTPPSYVLTTPTAGTKRSYLSWLSINVTDNIWSASSDVPYIRTGWTLGNLIWTDNIWWINNQYGIDIDNFFLSISGNGSSKEFFWGDFSNMPSASLFEIASGKTWQFFDRNYTLIISWSQLFNYGIEQPITITWIVKDRMGMTTNFWPFTFNQPVWPWLIAWSASPAWGETLVSTNESIKLTIADDRAGVDSWSISITLQWIWWTAYWPYTFSWSDLNLSGILGNANQPDYKITLINHPTFPSSWTIQVIVNAQDMVGNYDTVSNYIFTTSPSCIDLGCCDPLYLQTWNTMPFLYNGTILNVSGGNNPSFTVQGNTWILYCGTENQGMNIYKWTDAMSWSAAHVSYFDLSHLIFSWSNVKATLSGNTIYLQKIYVPPITTWGCIGTCGWWWWGGWTTISKDNCTLPSSSLACANTEGNDNSSSYYDGTCCSPTEEGHGAATGCDVSDSTYTTEITEAFQRAYNLNITSKCPITTARLERPIIRMEAAKMMSMFTIQILWLYPDTHKADCDKFSDTKNLSEEMKFFTKTACQLNLMGLKSDGKTVDKTFDPHEYVNRAQFGTILSRLIYGDKYNVYTGEEMMFKRYQKHLNALNVDNIMKQIQNPSMLEERARVLLMLNRTVENNLVEKYRLVAPAHNWALSLLENIR